MNMRVILIWIFFSTISFVGNTQEFNQHQEVSGDLQIVQKKGKYGLWNSSESKFEIKAKYLFAHYWEFANLIYFFDKRGEIQVVSPKNADHILSFEYEVDIKSSFSQEVIEINGTIYNDRLEMVHQKFEYKDYVTSQIISTKNEMMFYEEYLNMEDGLYTRNSGYYSFDEGKWKIELGQGSVKIVDKERDIRYIINDTLNGYYKRSEDNFTLLTDFVSADGTQIPQKSIEEFLQYFYTIKNIVYLPKDGFIYQTNDQKWGFGQLSPYSYHFYEPTFEFVVFDVFANQYICLKENLLETHDLFYDEMEEQTKDTLVTKSRFAVTQSSDYYEMGYASFYSDQQVFNYGFDNSTKFSYVFYNKEDHLIYYGVQGDLYEFNYSPEMIEEWYLEGERTFDKKQHYFSGIYDLGNKKIIKHLPSASIFYTKDGFVTLDSYYVPYTGDVNSKESGLHYYISLRNSSFELTDSSLTSFELMTPISKFDSIAPPDYSLNRNCGIVYRNNKMALYQPEIPLLKSKFFDLVVESKDEMIGDYIINNDSIFLDEKFLTKLDYKGNIKITPYYTDQGGFEKGIYMSCISGDDSSLFQLDTTQLFPEGYQFDLGELSAVYQQLEIKNNFLLFQFSEPEPYSMYFNEEYYAVEVEDNSSFAYIKYSNGFQLVDELYNKLYAHGSLLFAYKGKYVYEDTSNIISIDDGWGEEYYEIIMKGEYYDVYNNKGEKIHDAMFEKYETIETGFVLYDDNYNCALMDTSGKLVTDFEYDKITFDLEIKQYKCEIIGGPIYDEFGEIIDTKEGSVDYISID